MGTADASGLEYRCRSLSPGKHALWVDILIQIRERLEDCCAGWLVNYGGVEVKFSRSELYRFVIVLNVWLRGQVVLSVERCR